MKDNVKDVKKDIIEIRDMVHSNRVGSIQILLKVADVLQSLGERIVRLEENK